MDFVLLSVHGGCNMFGQQSSQDSAPEIEMLCKYSIQSFAFLIPHTFLSVPIEVSCLLNIF